MICLPDYTLQVDRIVSLCGDNPKGKKKNTDNIPRVCATKY